MTPLAPFDPSLNPQTLPLPSAEINPPAAVGVVDAATQLMHQQRLVGVLRGVTEGLGLRGAQLHLLDDASAVLRVAADWGDDPAQPTRPLPSAQADLAAMAGGAVVLEDAEMVAEWDVPAPCRSAVCVPVASDTTIHGTLWLYGSRPRRFEDSELQLVEIAAGRLAVEIERRRLLDQRETAQPVLSPAAPALPDGPSLPEEIEELELAGGSDGACDGEAFHDWIELADGRVMVAAGSVMDTPGVSQLGARMTLHAARTAARCHAEQTLDAGELLAKVSRSVWQSTTGGESVSLAVALIDPREGVGSYALAGSAAALRVRASETEVAAGDHPPVGCEPAEAFPSHPFELNVRERLVLTTLDPRATSAKRINRLADAYRGLTANEHRRMTAEQAVEPLADSDDVEAVAVVRWR